MTKDEKQEYEKLQWSLRDLDPNKYRELKDSIDSLTKELKELDSLIGEFKWWSPDRFNASVKTPVLSFLNWEYSTTHTLSKELTVKVLTETLKQLRIKYDEVEKKLVSKYKEMAEEYEKAGGRFDHKASIFSR